MTVVYKRGRPESIAYDENPVKKFNKTICEELGIPAPEGYVEIA